MAINNSPLSTLNSQLFQRTRMLYGQQAMDRLSKSHVLFFGLGGVGGHCAEALARCGIGRFTLVDGDRVSVSNINRQAVALHSTVGLWKVDVMRGRILDIHPGATVRVIPQFYPFGEEGSFEEGGLWAASYDIIVDAIDDIPTKVELAAQARRRGIPMISSMGAGNKMDPARFEAADLYETSVCPLARAMRRRCRERGIESLRVVYSKEPPVSLAEMHTNETGRTTPGSVSFVTAAAGCVLAGEVVRMLLGGPEKAP